MAEIHEIYNTRQTEPGVKRRWFTDSDYWDLYIWEDPGGNMNSFQLCYNRGYTDEKALTWKKTGNYRHNSVNSTASWGKAKTDVLSQRESLDNTKIYDSFQRDSKVLEIKYREFILRKIREYENPA